VTEPTAIETPVETRPHPGKTALAAEKAAAEAALAAEAPKNAPRSNRSAASED